MNEDTTALTGALVLAEFSRITGIEFRIRGYDLKAQAQAFADSFTLEELRIVVEWTRWQIGRNEGGYNASSLKWSCLMDKFRDGAGEWAFIAFQERLGLANDAIRRKAWRPPWNKDKPSNIVEMKPQPSEAECAAMAERAIEQAREFAAKMGRAL